ncbi:hypothetical protein QCA50_003882 [Cerrena zonata]|uniref:Uncharacterized protein n=1 Tax=Cerrena zonata TaxID=2478898 RepID=A0AAW0GHT6_9APHY
MLAIVVNSSDTATQQGTRRLLLRLVNNNQTLPTSVFLEGIKVDTSDLPLVGGFGEVYRTTYGETIVAAKRLRRAQYV